jgi:deoxyribodipyrimidine photolyase-related protein
MKRNGEPVGGRYSSDVENRERWRGAPPAPTPPCFETQAVTREVAELVQTRFAHHPGTLDLAHLPARSAGSRRVTRRPRAEADVKLALLA